MSDSYEREVAVLGKVLEALSELGDESAARITQWLVHRYGPRSVSPSPLVQAAKRVTASVEARTDWTDFAALYAAANPVTGAEKALVAGYWLQVCRGALELDSQTMNAELKHLGHGVGNIAKALTDLMKQRPQPILQTRKSGKTKQARKSYRLTTAGVGAVQSMLSRTPMS